MADAIDSFLNGETDTIEAPQPQAAQPSQAGNLVAPTVSTPAVPAEQPVPQKPDRYDSFLNGDNNALDTPAARPINPVDVQTNLSIYQGVAPEQAARVDQLAGQHGLPFNVALDHQQDLEKVSEGQSIVKSLSETNEDGTPKFPNTVDMLSDPVKLAKWKDKVDQLKAIEGIIKNATPPTTAEKFKEAGSSALNTLSTMFRQGTEAATRIALKFDPSARAQTEALAQIEHDQMIQDGATPEQAAAAKQFRLSPEGNPILQGAKAIEAQTKEFAPPDPRLQESLFAHKVPSVLAMTGGFMATGALGELGTAAVALATTAGGAWDEAKAHNATDDQAMNAAIATAPTGLLYKVVPQRMLQRLFQGGGGQGAVQIIGTAIKEGATAATLFLAQGVASNAIAKEIYDKDRGYWDGQLDQAKSGGVGSAIASLIVSMASGKHVPVVNNSPHPEAVDMVQQHLVSSQVEAADIAKQDSQIKLLTELKKEVAPEVKPEGAAESTIRDPAQLSDFIEQSLKTNGHPAEMDIDPSAVHDVLFQGAKSDADIQAAQKKLDQFAQDVGSTPEEINKAIQNGTTVKANTGKLVGKYGTDPIFDAITKQMQEARDTQAENLKSKQAGFEDKLAQEKQQFAEPTQVKEIRDQLMKPKEEGGAGKTAQEADDNLKALLTPLRNIARQRGETLQQTFDRSGLRVVTGEDGNLFVQKVAQPEGALLQGEKLKTDSPEFKKWFGESKVVDESGKPLVVYHGTLGDFSAFKTDNSQLGAHFGTVEQAHNRLSFGKEYDTYGETEAFKNLANAGHHPSIIPVYLSLKHPLEMSSDVGDWSNLNDLKKHLGPQDHAVFTEKEMSKWKDSQDVKKALIKKGYDGVVYENEAEGKGKSYIAFHSEQIKSVNNRGTFDLNNQNTLFQGENVDYTPTIQKPGREAQQKAIGDKILEKIKPVPEGVQPKVVFMGGGTASGKSTLIEHIKSKVNPDFAKGYAEIDSDKIKAQIKEYADLVKNRDKRAAEVVHEESSKIAKDTFKQAIEKNVNTLYDATLSNPETTRELIAHARTHGYEVELIGTTVPLELALQRIDERFKQTGRYVSPKVAIDAHNGFAKNFPEYAKLSDAAQLFNTAGKTPLEIARKNVNKPLDILDNTAYDLFRKVNNNEGQTKETTQEAALNADNNSNQQGRLGQGGTGTEGQRNTGLQQNNEGQVGPLFHGGDNPRGVFHYIDNKATIRLFKTHDVSTFLHEANHFIVKEFESLVNSRLADAQSIKDWNTLLEYVGSKDGKLTREQHEKLADAGVSYYMEGKAPSPKLIDVFRRFKDRLMQLYKSADSLGVKLSDEVRSVFARWHASESEIDQANSYYNLQDVIKNLNDSNFKAKQVEEKVKEKTAAHVEALKEAKLKAATLDVDGQPIYRLLNQDKISPESVKQEFGESVSSELQKKFPQAFDENGSAIHELAIKHGFDSPAELVDTLRNTLPREDAINQRHQELIANKENEILSKNPSEVTSSDKETHSQESLQLLIDDTKKMQEGGKSPTQAMRKGSQDYQLTAKAYRDSAGDSISQMKAGEAAEYYRFAQAEKRFSAEVVRHLQKGNKKEALASRMKQLFNHAMVMESIKARAEILKIQNRYEYKKVGTLLKEGLENEFVSPVATLLSRFGLSNRKVDVPYDFAKIGEIDPVLAAMVPDVVKGQVGGDYRKVLTLDQLRSVDNFANSLIHVGRDVMRSLKQGKELKTADVVSESLSNMNQLNDKKLAEEQNRGRVKWQKFTDLVSSSTIQQQFLTEMADNFSLRTSGKMGIMRQLYHELIGRQVKESVLQKDISKDLEPIFKTLETARKRIEKENGKFFDIKELPLPQELKKDYRGKWTAERLMAFMLNTGNEGNRQSLENAYQFRDEQIKAASKYFTKEELKSFQGVWDTINKLYPVLDKAHFESYNRHIEKVEASPFEYVDKDGNTVKLDGGYYPLKFDPGIDTQAARNAEKDLMEQYSGVLRSSKPQDGFTMSRTPGHSLPPLLSLDVLTRHIADTIHYATHADIIRDWNKVTSNEAWKKVFTDKFGNKNYEETRTWLKDQAQKAPPPPASGVTRMWDRVFNSQRGLATVAAFGMNVKSGILIHHSLLNAAHALEWKWLMSGTRDLDAKTLSGLSSGDAWKQIADVSPYMKDHALSWDRDVRAMSEELKPGGPGKLDQAIRKASSAMGKELTMKDVRQASMFLLTAGHQRMAAMVWKGALNKYMETIADKSMSQSENMEKAVKYADAMVQDTQASSLRGELNAVQRDQGFMRFLSAFMSWNFKYGGRLQYENRAWREGKISNAEYASHVIHETLAPALIRTALLGAMTATAPTAWQWMGSVPEMLLSWIPILKDVSKVFHYSTKQNKIDFDLTTAFPAAEGGKRIAKAGSSVLQYANDKKDVGPMLWDMARATDYFTGTGATKPAQDLYRFYENASKEEE